MGMGIIVLGIYVNPFILSISVKQAIHISTLLWVPSLRMDIYQYFLVQKDVYQPNSNDFRAFTD
jgi:hypothetical protein